MKNWQFIIILISLSIIILLLSIIIYWQFKLQMDLISLAKASKIISDQIVDLVTVLRNLLNRK